MKSLVSEVIGVIVTALSTTTAVAWFNFKEEQKMCDGIPKIVNMSDTVRTFTCEVKLKEKR